MQLSSAIFQNQNLFYWKKYLTIHNYAQYFVIARISSEWRLLLSSSSDAPYASASSMVSASLQSDIANMHRAEASNLDLMKSGVNADSSLICRSINTTLGFSSAVLASVPAKSLASATILIRGSSLSRV